MKTKLSIRRVVLPLVAFAMGGLRFYHVAGESQTAPPTAPPEYPARSPYEDSIAASGVVEARSENIATGAALAGLVLEVYVPSDRAGTHVKAGQPLFRVDDRHLKSQLKVAEAQLAMAEARLDRLQRQPRPEELPPSLAKVKAATANAARLEDQYERSKRLIGTGAVPQEEIVTRQRAHAITMRFVRVEPYVVPKKSLTGENTERVDTRVLQVIYAIERTEYPVYVGQQLDVFIDGEVK